MEKVHDSIGFVIASLVIFFAKYLYLVIILLGILFFLFQNFDGKKKMTILLLISFPLAFIVAQILGKLYYNPRPFVLYHFKPLIEHAPNNGFPSDHALLSFMFATLIFIFNKKLGLILWLLGFLVGFSRVFAGIHSPIDIFGSFSINLASIYFSYLFFKRFFDKNKNG